MNRADPRGRDPSLGLFEQLLIAEEFGVLGEFTLGMTTLPLLLLLTPFLLSGDIPVPAGSLEPANDNEETCGDGEPPDECDELFDSCTASCLAAYQAPPDLPPPLPVFGGLTCMQICVQCVADCQDGVAIIGPCLTGAWPPP